MINRSTTNLLIVIFFIAIIANITHAAIKQGISLSNQIVFRYSFKDLTKDYSWNHSLGIQNRLWVTNRINLGLGANYSKIDRSYHYDTKNDTLLQCIPAWDCNWWQLNLDISYEYKVSKVFNPSVGLFSYIDIIKESGYNTAWWPSIGVLISNRFYFNRFFIGLNGYGGYEFCDVRSYDTRTKTYIKQIPLKFGINFDFGIYWSYLSNNINAKRQLLLRALR
jgi:hypothetical protein